MTQQKSTTNVTLWTMDVRVRERNLKAGTLTDKDVDKYLAGLPDHEPQTESFATSQPALAQPPAPPPPPPPPPQQHATPVAVAAAAVADDVDDVDDEDDEDEDDDVDGDVAEPAEPAAPVVEEPVNTGNDEGEPT